MSRKRSMAASCSGFVRVMAAGLAFRRLVITLSMR
jgi:hypothetical protein